MTFCISERLQSYLFLLRFLAIACNWGMFEHAHEYSPHECENCVDLRRKYTLLEHEHQLLQKKFTFEVECAQNERDEWEKKYCEVESVVEGSFSRSQYIDSDVPPPQQLTIDNFGKYYQDMLNKYPFLAFIMQFCLSLHHNRKENAADTTEEWLMSSDFYKSYLLDTILKSRNSKAVLRTQLFLGVYFYLVKVPEPAWRILERLRVLPSRQYVQDYLQSQPMIKLSDDLMIVFCFDNCDILMHVTHRHEINESSMFQMVTRLVFEIPRSLSIPAISLWKEYTKAAGVAFGNWLRMSDKDTINIANLTTTTIIGAIELGGLRFALEKGSSSINRAKMLILPPEINKSTAKYEDVAETLRKFFNAYIRGTSRTFALVSGDQQVFTLIWFLRLRFPTEFQWVVPIPGEWHWEWHILRGIFRLWGHYLLKPLSVILGYKNLDLTCKVFHYGEDFLEVVSIALCKWYKVLQLKWPDHTPVQILHQIKPFSHAYELLYFFLWYVCPYWYTRAVLKVGNAAALTNMWRYWLHLFIATGKWKYAGLTIRFLWILDTINVDVKAVFDEFRTFSSSGAVGTGVAYDNMIEMVRFHANPALHYVLHSFRLLLFHFYR